jgi:hypothetical protein
MQLRHVIAAGSSVNSDRSSMKIAAQRLARHPHGVLSRAGGEDKINHEFALSFNEGNKILPECAPPGGEIWSMRQDLRARPLGQIHSPPRSVFATFRKLFFVPTPPSASYAHHDHARRADAPMSSMGRHVGSAVDRLTSAEPSDSEGALREHSEILRTIRWARSHTWQTDRAYDTVANDQIFCGSDVWRGHGVASMLAGL